MYDAHLQTNVLVVAPILLMLADNPRHSELLNHLGGRANKYCRMCMVSFVCAFFICAFYKKKCINTFQLGLALKLAQRFSLYSNIISRLCENHSSLQSSYFNSQVDRNEIPTEIAALRTKELALLQMTKIRDLPSESGKQARRTEYGLKEDQNLLFTLSVDMFR